jgi:hypothetical protein
MTRRRGATGATVIDVGDGRPVRAEVIPPEPAPPSPPVPAGVQIGDVPIALPPELAQRIAAIHEHASGLVALGTELARGVQTFAAALEDARAVLAPRRARGRRRRR